MEGKEEAASVGVAVSSEEAQPSPRAPTVSENTNPNTSSLDRPSAAPDQAAPAAVSGAPASGGSVGSLDGKKKRGRPRKYGPDGVALSPMPISASVPLTGELLPWRRGKVVSVEPVKKKHKFEFESAGKMVKG